VLLLESKRLMRFVRRSRPLLDALGLDIAIVGRGSALRLLASKSDELARAVDAFEALLTMYQVLGHKTAQKLALQWTDELLVASKSFSGSDAKSIETCLAVWRKHLSEGVDEVGELTAKQIDLRDAAAARAAARLERELDELERVVVEIQDEIARVMSGRRGSDAERKAFGLLCKALDPGDSELWRPIVEKVKDAAKTANAAAVRRAGGVSRFGEAKFRHLFRGKASNIKGLIMEHWFWQSDIWRQWSKDVLKRAHSRAIQLRFGTGKAFQTHVISQPLRVLDTGQEIYDGAVLVVHEIAKGPPKHYAGYIEAIVQIKAEKRISLVRQIKRDVKREAAGGGKLRLRLDDGSIFDLAPSVEDPLRLIVAPELPTFTQMQRGAGHVLVPQVQALPPGVDLRFAPTLLDATQLDDVAYAILRRIVEGG
jgi:hypothetical protein